MGKSEPYVCAVIKEVSGQGMAQNPTFSDIIRKQLHLPLLILVFAFNLYIEKKQNQQSFRNTKVVFMVMSPASPQESASSLLLFLSKHLPTHSSPRVN